MTKEQLENTIAILKEMGAQYINTCILNSKTQNIIIKLVKSYCKIPKDDDIASKLYSYLHQPPKEVTPLKPLDENMNVYDFRKECLLHYIQWRLEIPASKIKLQNRIRKRLIHRSFNSLKQSFDFLHYDIGLSIGAIRDHNCLEGCSPPEINKILENIDSICGIPIRKLFLFWPRLSKAKYDGLLAVKKHLEQHQFTQIQLENCCKVLLLEEKKLESGLQVILNTPELKVLINHPNVLHIILIKNRIEQRLEYLNYLKIKDVTVNVLLKTNDSFDRLIKSPSRKYKYKDIIALVVNYSLADASTIKNHLSKHPHWRHVDLVTVHETLKYLTELFDSADIFDNLTLIFYPRNIIRDTVTKLKYINRSLTSADRYAVPQILALCEYEIEKDFHFSGNGIWERIEPNSKNPEQIKHYDNKELINYLPKDSIKNLSNFQFVNTTK
ncbi:transcription termination factor 5, mitochondrial isoform X2 [Cotesia glomerata]|nr:transcription termination factor 5, mitochondrial isoform X2 [Cotesia glomerata]